MFARITHLAITSDNYATNARFYQALFGMKASNTQRPARAAPVGDGQINRLEARLTDPVQTDDVIFVRESLF